LYSPVNNSPLLQMCDAWLWIHRLFGKRAWSSWSILLRPSHLQSGRSHAARPRPALSQRSHVLSWRHLPMCFR